MVTRISPSANRLQHHFAESGVDGPRDKTRKPGMAPIAADITARVVAPIPAFAGGLCTEPPHAATHWTGRAILFWIIVVGYWR